MLKVTNDVHCTLTKPCSTFIMAECFALITYLKIIVFVVTQGCANFFEWRPD